MSQNTYCNPCSDAAVWTTPGAAWPKFRAPFCVTGGRQAHWAQRERGRAVHEIVHSYIYSKEVTSSNLHQQLIPYEGQCVLCGGSNQGTATLCDRLKFVLILFFIWSSQRSLFTVCVMNCGLKLVFWEHASLTLKKRRSEWSLWINGCWKAAEAWTQVLAKTGPCAASAPNKLQPSFFLFLHPSSKATPVARGMACCYSLPSNVQLISHSTRMVLLLDVKVT